MTRLHSTWFSWCTAAAIAIVALSGCSMPKAKDFKPSKLFSLGDDDEPEEGIPVRMVGAWTDTVLSRPGEKSQRGFGGRLMFYGEDNDKPILVDGQLVVYAFDEMGREPTDNKPTRRYVFPPDQVTLHMSKSDLGATYSFWLPWDEAGGPQTEVSLICRFEPRGGAVITSEQTRHRLPGSLPASVAGHRSPPKLPEGVPARPAQITLESLQASRAAQQGVQLASYESPIASNPQVTSIDAGVASPLEPAPRMTTTSITLPQNYKFPMSAPVSTQPATPIHGSVPNAIQPPQAMPTPTSATPMRPMQHTVMPPTAPAGGVVQAGGVQPATSAMSPSLRPLTSAPAPALYTPTSQHFGFPPTTQQQSQTPQIGSSLARLNAARAAMLNNIGTAQPGAPPQQPTIPAPGQPQTITQPASQPLPSPTPLTTTISYPPGAPQY